MRAQWSPTERAEAEELRAAGKTHRQIARAIGKTRKAVVRFFERQREADRKWRAPVDVPDGMVAPLTTVQYNSEGEVVNEWRRLTPAQQSLFDLADKLAKRVSGKGKINRSAAIVRNAKADLLQETVIADPHLGMYAWPDETGSHSYDIKRATETVRAAVDHACGQATPGTHVIVFNGDIMHGDSRSNKTEMSGNILDMDSRWSKILEHSEECMVSSVELAAQKAGKVIVVVNPGNHDWHTAHALGRILSAYWRNSKAVTVMNNARPRKTLVWGNTLLGWAHGDRVKPADWPKVIAAEFPGDWGKTKYRYLHLGHVHHSRVCGPTLVDEQSGLTVEFLRSLCPIDAWHAESGYVGQQHGCDTFLYSKKWGMEARWFFNSERVWGHA